MKLTPNPHVAPWHEGPDLDCVCGAVWSAAVKATLEDVAGDLEEMLPQPEHRFSKWLIARYRAAMKGVGG